MMDKNRNNKNNHNKKIPREMAINYWELRQKFIDFFKNKGHIFVNAAPLIQKKDPSLFFTNAGMNQFKSYFVMEDEAPYSRAVTIQPCIRAGGKHNDLDNVGFTTRHHTFFEMMGNFSFYDYFKEEAISYALEFLLEELGIDEKKLFFTVHKKDGDAYNIFKGKTKQPVIQLDSDDNFWSMGELGPCGYCGEIYYYIGEGNGTEDGFHKSFMDTNPQYLEIWNLVFMEFNKTTNGNMELLGKQSIDTGMGLERLLSVLEGTYDNYQTSIVLPLVLRAKELFPHINDNVAYIGADHAKTTLFLLNEGLEIGSEGPSYVLRRIIRRALTYLKTPGFYKMLPAVAHLYKGVYEFPHLNKAMLLLQREEELFFHTIKNGYERLQNSLDREEVNEAIIFKLYETYGLPLEFSTSILEAKGIRLDDDKLQSFMNEHRKISGQMINMDFNNFTTISTCYEKSLDYGKVQLILVDNNITESVTVDNECIFITNSSPFYPRGGGQEGDRGFVYGTNFKGQIINTTKKHKTILHHCQVWEGELKVGMELKMEVDMQWRNGTAKHHSATHLLHGILQQMFGAHIEQKGSFITNNRFRFDYNFNRKLTKDEVLEMENKMKEIIQNNYKVEVTFMNFEEAKNKGAEYLKNMEYEEIVRVVSMGDISFVLCGGIHVNNTSEIGSFKLVGDKNLGSGIRRLEVVCESN